MKAIVLGANGRTGKEVLRLALERGMDVTAVVRSENKLPHMGHHRLTTVVGDPCDPTFLASVFNKQDVVISTLGGRRPTTSATSVYYQSASAIVKAAEGKDLERVLVTSTALLFPACTLPEKVLRWVARANVRSATRMEEIFRESGLDWTFARCGFLKNADESEYRARKGSLPREGTSVSRLALAHFLVDAIEREDAHCSVFGVSRQLPERPD